MTTYQKQVLWVNYNNQELKRQSQNQQTQSKILTRWILPIFGIVYGDSQ